MSKRLHNKIVKLEKSLAKLKSAARKNKHIGSAHPVLSGCSCPRSAIFPSTGCIMYYRCSLCNREFSHGELCGRR